MKYNWLSLLAAGTMLPLAAVELPSIFTDNMVLQRDRAVPVWGTGRAGEAVSVQFAGQTVSTTAGKDGRWQVKLAPLAASSDGATLTVKGDNTLTRSNVLVGDVWLCAGQSNMQYGLQSITGSRKLIEAFPNPDIRLFQVPNVWSRTPQADVKAQWNLCSPQTLPRFSAVGYLVGRDLQSKLNVPIGLINISWGGCRIESMTAPESFAAVSVTQGVADEVAKQIADLKSKKDTDLRKDKQRLPNVLFNAMVHPLTPFAVRGMLWYQGEDNHSEGMRYAEKLRALAHTWRTYFANPDMPIFIVQLPPWQYGREKSTLIPNFWAAQQHFAEHDSNAGFITTTDCGDPKDIHPRDKMPLARRLANLVLYKAYGIGSDAALAPTFRSARAEGSTFVVEFNQPNDLRTRDNEPVSHLMLAGEDGLFHPATGVVRNNKLFVTSPEVSAPVRLRFGWDKLANPNLVNRAGVPVAPFDTGFGTDK